MTLHEAAKRWRDDDYRDTINGEWDANADTDKLADAMAAELDDSPITKVWLAHLGGELLDNELKVRFRRGERLPVGLWLVGDGWKAMLEIGEHHSACIVRGLETRGEFRLLAAALQIPLKEQADG